MSSRFQNLLKGFRRNFQFSNGFELNFNRLFRPNRRLARYVWKNKFVFECDTSRGDHIAVQECLIERAYDPLLDRCDFPQSSISYVNIGANIGAFDVLLVERGLTIRSGLSVELNPDTANRCRENLRRNGFDSTRVVNAAIGAEDGRLAFHPSGCSLNDNIFDRSQPGQSGGTEVEMCTLETLLKKHAGDATSFDLLKLDCEGAEYAVLRLTPRAVLRSFRNIIVEFHLEMTRESVPYEILEQAGFRCFHGRPGKLRFTDLFVRDSDETSKRL